MGFILLSLLVSTVSYLLGCFSTGLFIAGKDGVKLREMGSKNTGASNVLRVMGVRKGLFTFIGDVVKALLACCIGALILPGATFGIPGFGMMLAGMFAIIGHNWPVFYRFKGGKGVACSVAVIIFVNPIWGMLSGILCIAVIALSKYISLGSLTMLLVHLVCIWIVYWGQWFPCLWAFLLLALCVYQHRSNIQRLLKGTENKIGQKVT